MNGWFITISVIYILNIGINLAKNGEKKDENYSFVTALIGALIGLLLTYMAVKIGF